MTDDLFSVKDQVVLVSGASRGIGKAIAQGFAAREAKVVITGRVQETVQKTAEEICPPGGTVVGKVCDVADAQACGRLADEVVDELGRIDTLVNCAGVNKRMNVERYDEPTYDFITNVNIRGAFFLATAVGRHMIRARRGSQINIDSINSHTPLDRVTVYAMSKAAMSQMTKCLAMEWGPHGIRVNAIGPGFTLTELARPLWENQPKMNEWRNENTPLRRIGQPEDMVGAAIFLASEASSFVTGQVLYVDGGTTCGLFWPIEV
ncbi:MAG: SDR family NAD(P)-dependent oxidoreductase [Planctomycetota bacterium]|jgi:NAD(P)-dependent dehydrogenase (short-subunit alcohol dehydrogenase family)